MLSVDHLACSLVDCALLVVPLYFRDVMICTGCETYLVAGCLPGIHTPIHRKP
jgi:hypothetical protein